MRLRLVALLFKGGGPRDLDSSASAGRQRLCRHTGQAADESMEAGRANGYETNMDGIGVARVVAAHGAQIT